MEPVGLNAHWATQAYYAGPGRPNRTSGGMYIVHQEEEDDYAVIVVHYDGDNTTFDEVCRIPNDRMTITRVYEKMSNWARVVATAGNNRDMLEAVMMLRREDIRKMCEKRTLRHGDVTIELQFGFGSIDGENVVFVDDDVVYLEYTFCNSLISDIDRQYLVFVIYDCVPYVVMNDTLAGIIGNDTDIIKALEMI